MFAREAESGRPVTGGTMHPNSYVAVLTPGATELDRVGEQGLQRGDAGKTTSSGSGSVPWGDEPGEGQADFCRSPGAWRRGWGKASLPPLCLAHGLLPPDMDRTHAVGSPGAQAFRSQPSGPSSLRDCGNQSPQSVSWGVFHPRALIPCRVLATQSSPACCCWASPVSPPGQTAWPGIT